MAKRILFLGLLVLIFSSSTILGQGSKRIILNHFFADPEQGSRVYITDTDGVDQNVTLVFFGETGDILGQKRMNLPSNGTVAVNPFDVIKRRASGKAVAEASSRIIGEYWQVVETDDASCSVAVPLQPALGHDKLVVQHFISAPFLISNIYISDTRGEGDIPIEIKFFDDGSNLLSKISRTIPSNGSLTIKPWIVLQKKVVGSAHIKTLGGPIVGEYWQIVNGKFEDPKKGKKRYMNYALAVSLAGKIDTPLKIIETPTEIRLTLEVNFDDNDVEVRDVDELNFEEATKIIKRYLSDGEVVIVEGHTDEAGEADYNLKLSQKRADHVKAYLVSSFNLNKDQLRAIGYGELRPIVPGATGAAGQVNRRIVFSIPKI